MRTFLSKKVVLLVGIALTGSVFVFQSKAQNPSEYCWLCKPTENWDCTITNTQTGQSAVCSTKYFYGWPEQNQ